MTEQLNGKYIIERPLGRGGMGEVFAGRSTGMEGFSRPVAIKRIHAQHSADHERRSMLVAEALLTARLSHSNIVAVHDLDQDEAGRLFLVMELVDGVDLASLLRTGALPLPVVLYVTCEILRGLGHAHDLPVSDDPVCGIVHRDVSPQNMLIGWDGAVKVSDFGLAKARATMKATASLLLKGKIAYMSPEHANGAALDGRSDLFSVGVMLWEMICGARLFGRETFEATARSVLFDSILSPRSLSPDLPADIERITMRLLERDLGRRYHAAGAAIEALLACPAYPKNGRDLLSALLVERLPDRAPQRSAGGAQIPIASFTEEGTALVPLVPPVAPLLAQPAFPAAFPAAGHARRVARLALLVVATALATILVAGVVLRMDDGGAPAAPVAPPGELPVDPRQPGELRAITVRSVPLPSGSSSPPPPTPTVAPARPSTRASSGGVPARAPRPDPMGRTGIRVLDLRELARLRPAEPEERRMPR